MTLGQNIKRIAKEKNMSIYSVMKKSEVSTGYLYDLVNEKQTNPGIETVKKIAKALEVSVGELIN